MQSAALDLEVNYYVKLMLSNMSYRNQPLAIGAYSAKKRRLRRRATGLSLRNRDDFEVFLIILLTLFIPCEFTYHVLFLLPHMNCIALDICSLDLVTVHSIKSAS